MGSFFWIASYPKSGNTWLRLMLQSLEHRGAPVDFATRTEFAPIASRRDALDYWCGIDSSDLTDDEAMALRPIQYTTEASVSQKVMLRKVHDAWTKTPKGDFLFPAEVTCGSVYMVRDPRDIVVSFAHHRGSDIDSTIALMAQADAALSVSLDHGTAQLRQRLLSWSAHVQSWLSAVPAPMLVRYEDMLANPAAVLAAVASKLGFEASPSLLSRAVEATAFSTLQAAELTVGFIEKPAAAPNFFRRGKAGVWRDTLTAAQTARIEADHGEIMVRFGYL